MDCRLRPPLDAENIMLEDIADHAMGPQDIVPTYALALQHPERCLPCDFGKVHRAIIERWSIRWLREIRARARRAHTKGGVA